MLYKAQSVAVRPQDWNTLRVIAVGDRIQLLVNGYLMADLTDSTFSAGKAGLIAFHNLAGSTHTFDWVKLDIATMPFSGSISAEQQAHNEAAQRNPPIPEIKFFNDD